MALLSSKKSWSKDDLEHLLSPYQHNASKSRRPAAGQHLEVEARSSCDIGAEESVVRSYHSVALGGALLCVASVVARADTDLTGKWVGAFNGVQVEIPLQPGPFGAPGGEARKVQTPRFVEATLTIEFEIQKKGLAVGRWTAGEFAQKFVCAQVGETIWNCVDAAGRASVEITPAAELKVCYLDHRQGAQGAGCGLLRRAN
jgi:hypothetical protein